MASLNKLAIRGIRSFDDKSISVIEFYSPVTVIVGHNGSGKTVRYIVPSGSYFTQIKADYHRMPQICNDW